MSKSGNSKESRAEEVDTKEEPIRKDMYVVGATQRGKSGDFAGWAGTATVKARRNKLGEARESEAEGED